MPVNFGLEEVAPTVGASCVSSEGEEEHAVDNTTTFINNNDDIVNSTIITKKVVPSSKSMPNYQSMPVRQRHEKLLRDALDIILDEAVFRGTARSARVLEWHDPDTLAAEFDFRLSDEGESHDRLLRLVSETIRRSVKTGHPYFANQLFSSLDPYGLLGQWMTDALNPSAYTYEVAPVFVLMEEVVLEEMRKIVGYEPNTGDGIFCPGGSMANGYAIGCARHKFNPSIKTQGLHGLPRLVLFTSEDAHYSIKKLASFVGIGTDNVYLIKTDSVGKMRPDVLESEIQRALSEGATPFMVCATTGTTVYGAYDPIEPIADICSRYGLWMHVDAAWGGGALMSRKHRHLLRGIQRADSVTWNPHKLLAAPQQCSAFLTRHQGLLAAANSCNATYLFQQDKFYDTRYDTGDKHLQCGRRVDVLKFWTMWKAKGTLGLERHIDRVFECAEEFTENVRRRPGFELVLDEPECTNVCFWYIPPSLRDEIPANRPFLIDDCTPEFRQRLHKVAPKIKERMMKEGSMMVTYQPRNDLPNFFRIVFQNSGLEPSDIDHLVKEFDRLGRDL